MSAQSTLLIVDDEERNRALLQAILEPMGYKIVLAEDGQEALEKTLELRPDLILLDVMMPDITGYEVCETIRQDPDLAEIPVLLVTALNDRESRLKGIDAGADDFLSKPVDVVEIQARVKTVTRLNRYRRLVAEREKFSKIADFATDALLLLDGDNRVHYANAKAAQLLGVDSMTAEGRVFFDLADSRFQLQPADVWKRWREGGPPEDKFLRYLVGQPAGGGQAVWLQAQAFKLPETGGADWLVRLQDVTGLMQQRREQWSFHRMLSHKMRTPLNGLIGTLESMADSDEARRSSLMADSLKDAMTSARRLEEQVKDVLLYLDAPKMTRMGRCLAVDDVVRQATDVARRLGLVDPEINAARELAGRSLGFSASAMDVVLTELFENALKFHPRMSPRVAVAIRPEREGFAAMTVTDDGGHLSPEALEQAGQPYFQGEAKVTGEVAGMGLGLAMVSAMAWEVGGGLEIANVPDGGVRVALRLPLED